jgi:hypothetical protein
MRRDLNLRSLTEAHLIANDLSLYNVSVRLLLFQCESSPLLFIVSVTFFVFSLICYLLRFVKGVVYMPATRFTWYVGLEAFLCEV